MTWLAVALGGALGAALRHAVSVVVLRLAHGHVVPYATLLVNVVGCAAIGVIAGSLAGGRLELSQSARAFVIVGVLGGFTTFSSFSLDTLTLVRTGLTGTALLNVAGHLILTLLAVFAGFAVGLGRNS